MVTLAVSYLSASVIGSLNRYFARIKLGVHGLGATDSNPPIGIDEDPAHAMKLAFDDGQGWQARKFA
ncbi:MAG: hypothetical protein R2684_16940 [Pyrinomonadaceae bacterium]